MAKPPVAPPEPAPASRGERIVMYMFFAILGLGIAAIVALLIAGVNAKGDFWAAVQLTPLIALPLSIILLVVLVVLNAVRRGRAAKVASK